MSNNTFATGQLLRTAVLLLAVLISSTASAQTRPSRTDLGSKAESILWIGNSFFYYNNGMHNHFGQLVRAAGGRSRSTLVTISGAGLDWQNIDSLLRPDGLGRYSFVGENELRFSPPGRQYDTGLMMDCSQCPVHPELQKVFHDTVKKDAVALRKVGMQPVLFMSWAYKDKPEMTGALAGQYTLAGNANDALVVPAGLAFARVISKRANIELYEPDRRHPSLAGTYLAACTVYATLYLQSPVGLRYTAGLPAETVALLQRSAWETVQEYFRKYSTCNQPWAGQKCFLASNRKLRTS